MKVGFDLAQTVMINHEQFKDTISFLQAFPDNATCIKYFEQMRWNGTPTCPHCEYPKAYKFTNNHNYKCANRKCHKKFNVLAKTPFENTKIPIQRWFLGMYLCAVKQKGISSVQFSKELGISQKSAWFMLHRIRTMLENDVQMFSGVIEVDETYVGGKAKNKHYSKRKKGTQGRNCIDKIPVFGILERGGNVKTFKVNDVSGKELKSLIYTYVEAGSSIMSDEWKSYRGLNRWYKHAFVEHGRYQYVDGDCYTNTLESYWSGVKRSIIGVYHKVSRKHIQRYCAEFDFKYNQRKIHVFFRFTYCLLNSINRRLRYMDLVKG